MQSKQSNMSSTSKIQTKILSLNDLQVIIADINKAVYQLSNAVKEAQLEYSLYINQKKYAEEKRGKDEVAKQKNLFAGDFADFEKKLKNAVQARNEFYENFQFPLTILGDNNSCQSKLKEIEKSLDQLNAKYYVEKPLYDQEESKKDSKPVKQSKNTIISESEFKSATTVLEKKNGI